MFNKEKGELEIKEAETIIGPSIKVKGNFKIRIAKETDEEWKYYDLLK